MIIRKVNASIKNLILSNIADGMFEHSQSLVLDNIIVNNTISDHWNTFDIKYVKNVVITNIWIDYLKNRAFLLDVIDNLELNNVTFSNN